MVQELIAEHKTIFLEFSANADEYTQRVLEDYDKCKYFFRAQYNATSVFHGMTDSLVHLREMTGFNKVGYLFEDIGWTKGIQDGLDYVLPEVHGFDVVYRGKCPFDTVDFTSYFAAAEAAGVEVLMPLLSGLNGIAFVTEYHVRQSPLVIYGGLLNSWVAGPQGWVNSDGKCNYISNVFRPIEAGYPFTSKTMPARNAYMDRWGEIPDWGPTTTYNILRYILPDAIERAGTLDVDAVITALETTSIETTDARNFAFTSSHDLMMANPNNPDDDHSMVLLFQWVDGNLVPVYPKKIMEEAGATYKFPDWPGPWD
jgi:branched-chain amino acid transport system substrate-binding protein